MDFSVCCLGVDNISFLDLVRDGKERNQSRTSLKIVQSYNIMA